MGLQFLILFSATAILLLCVSAGAQVVCPTLGYEFCACYPETRQIRCESTTVEFNASAFINYGKSLKGDWHLLYIIGTKITAIEADTFSDATFQKIWIEQNKNLEKIASNAFKETSNTNSLIIMANEKLAISDNYDLFDLAAKVGKSLQFLDFKENNIATIKATAFSQSGKFPLLELIRLDNQHAKVSIAKGAFSQLPNLRQLSLDKNKIANIADGSRPIIDLSAIKLNETYERIEVYLNNNEFTEWDAGNIVNNKINTVWVDLENNGIVSLAKMITNLNETNQFLFVSGNPINCDSCADIIKARNFTNPLQGLQCDLDYCLNHISFTTTIKTL